MDLSSLYTEVKQLLSISEKDFDLEQNINHFYKKESDENKLQILRDILNFINKFSMFKDIKPFMHSLYNCINNTLEIRPKSIFDFEELLMKNSIMYFIQQYITYSKIIQKDQVLELLTDSFEKLEKQPLIMNIGLLLKPMYQDLKYLNNLEKLKEVQISYNLSNNIDLQIKKEIANWLETQEIKLNNQDKLKENLKQEFKNLVTMHKIPIDSEKSKKLELEVIEMLTMKLTMKSLMEHIQEDSFEPNPIK